MHSFSFKKGQSICQNSHQQTTDDQTNGEWKFVSLEKNQYQGSEKKHRTQIKYGRTKITQWVSGHNTPLCVVFLYEPWASLAHQVQVYLLLIGLRAATASG